MFEYQTLFDARGEQYNQANRLYPEARREEARALLAHLSPHSDSPWLDVSSGGGYLSARAVEEGCPRARFACDGSVKFLRAAGRPESACAARSEELPFSDGSVGGAACLAALHHSESPESALRELLRVCRPGARAAVGDVAAGSRAARVLNGFVDRHTEAGHRGRFYEPGFFSRALGLAGGREIRGERMDLQWWLPRRTDAVLFFRGLYGLREETQDSGILEALDFLGAEESGGAFRVPWTMNFASAARA
jgi:SAM-dependent methyltransferase